MPLSARFRWMIEDSLLIWRSGQPTLT